MSTQYFASTIFLLAFLAGHSFATSLRNYGEKTMEPDPPYYQSSQNMSSVNMSRKELITKLLRIPSSDEHRSPRLKRQTIREDMVIVLDASGSIGTCNFKKAKQALKNMLDLGTERGYDNKYAAVTFSNYATTSFNFATNPGAGKKMKQISYLNGGTNTQAGLKEAKRLFENPSSGKRAGVTKIVLLVTDGPSNTDSHKTIPNANLLKNTGVEIFVIAIGDNISVNEINMVASPNIHEHVFRFDDMSAFLDSTRRVLDYFAPGKYQGQSQITCN